MFPTTYNVLFQLLILSWILLLLRCEAKISEDDLRQYLQNTYEKEASQLCYKSATASFDFVTDIKNKIKEEITVNNFLLHNINLQNLLSQYFYCKYFVLTECVVVK